MREERLLSTVAGILNDYDHTEPLSRYLKNYFNAHRNMGSRDRRETREWVFNFFRIGNNLSELGLKERLAVANFLCSEKKSTSLDYLLNSYSPFDNSQIELTVEEKIQIVRIHFPGFTSENIFPLHSEISPAIDIQAYCYSFLKQPLLWFRVRKTYQQEVLDVLEKSNISFAIDKADPLAFSCPNGSALNTLELIEKGWIEIQDRSSQQIRSLLKPNDGEHWWDACSGSGGKSLLLLEEAAGIRLTVSDIRESILTNLEIRTRRTGYSNLTKLLLDVSENSEKFPANKFDGIIADVPCSGSGTWGRNPEWLCHFDKETLLSKYQPLQRKIISNLVHFLKPGAPLVYITCSVFCKENEENLSYFEKNLPVKTEFETYISGTEFGANTLYAVRLIRI